MWDIKVDGIFNITGGSVLLRFFIRHWHILFQIFSNIIDEE